MREELERAIAGYREQIATLEDIKLNAKPNEKNAPVSVDAEIRIQRLKRSIASLENFLSTLG
jgi:hypothetical protein